MTAAEDFRNFLLADMEATSSTEFATDLLAQAKAKIKAGKGELAFLENGSVNGKNFTRAKTLSALDVARACRIALELYAGAPGSSPFTFLDLSRALP